MCGGVVQVWVCVWLAIGCEWFCGLLNVGASEGMSESASMVDMWVQVVGSILEFVRVWWWCKRG